MTAGTAAATVAVPVAVGAGLTGTIFNFVRLFSMFEDVNLLKLYCCREEGFARGGI